MKSCQVSAKQKVVVISIISALFTLNLDITNAFVFLPLIPIMYGLLYALMFPSNLTKGPGVTMMLLVLGIRYLLCPPLFRISGYYFNRFNENINAAIFLMLIEMFVIFITIYIYNRKHTRINYIIIKNRSAKSYTNRIPPFIPCLLIAVWIIIFLIVPDLYANRHFIVSSSDINSSIIKVSGVTTQLASWAEIYVIIYIVSILAKKAIANNSKFFFYLSLVVFLIPILFFSGNSRLSLLIPLVSVYFMIDKIYKNEAKSIKKVIIVYGLVAIIILSAQKFYSTADITTAGVMMSHQYAEMLNAYFGGLPNIMTGLNTYKLNSHSLELFFNDMLMNGMGISQYFIDSQTTDKLYNISFYSNVNYESFDQIVPTIIQGLLYGGPLLCIVPTIIMVYVTLASDRMYKYSANLEESYIYSRFAAMIGFAIPGNLTHLSAMFINVVLPILILIKLNHFRDK